MKTGYFKLKIGDAFFDIMHDETILECAYRHGIKMKYRCASGHCGVCRIKLLSGKVQLNHAGGISRVNRLNGFILTCCSTPLSDIEI